MAFFSRPTLSLERAQRIIELNNGTVLSNRRLRKDGVHVLYENGPLSGKGIVHFANRDSLDTAHESLKKANGKGPPLRLLEVTPRILRIAALTEELGGEFVALSGPPPVGYDSWTVRGPTDFDPSVEVAFPQDINARNAMALVELLQGNTKDNFTISRNNPRP